jgi:hypothetical protein
MKSLTTLLAFTGHAVILLGGLCSMSSIEAFQGAQSGSASDGRVEDIYIARSMRESRVTPTEFCAQARIGFDGARIEDQYTFRSTATRASDGLMVDTNVSAIGRLHACLGLTSDPITGNFYAEGILGTVTFTGSGECRTVKQDYPEPGMVIQRCFLELRDLPNGYVGGQLTTNSVNSRNVIGEKTDPPGYTQSSIATIRLWKRR